MTGILSYTSQACQSKFNFSDLVIPRWRPKSGAEAYPTNPSVSYAKKAKSTAPAAASKCPRISADFLAEERAALGMWYSQEYECAFLQPEGSLFSYEDIQAALTSDLQPLFLPAV